MPLEATVKNVYNKAKKIEDELNDLLTHELYGDEVDRDSIPDEPSLIGPEGQFYFKKLIWSSMYGQMNDKLRSMNALCDDLSIKTPEITTIRWISSATQWIETIVPKMDFGKSRKLQISIDDAEELAVTGSSIFLGVDDIVKRCVSRHKIVLYSSKKSRNFTVKIARGGTMYSVGGYVLRWIEFCFNALRGDLYLSNEMTKKLDSLCYQNNDSIASLEELSDLVDEAERELLIPPDATTMENAYELLNRRDFLTKTRDENGPILSHDLITGGK